MNGEVRLRFAVRDLGEPGRRAIIDGLGAIGADVADSGMDAGELTVVARDEASARRVREFVDGMRRTQRLIARKIVRQTNTASAARGCSDAELLASSDLQRIGTGLSGLTGDLLRLFRFFETNFRDMAASFDAADTHYPVMIPTETLTEMGYFGHFPQHVTFCCHFHDSLPVLEAIAAGGDHGSFVASLAPPEHVLAPGVCLPCYAQQRGTVLPPGEVKTLTMQNHVFRYEANNFRPLARGWDFSVRDIVFFGSSPDLAARREAVMDATLAFCEELELDATIELANDPFFLDASRDKAIYQRMGAVKYELLMRFGESEPALAAASFNLHRDFYTALYDIRLADGTIAESACMGFGIDRWLYAFVRQMGLDPAHWPSRVIAALR